MEGNRPEKHIGDIIFVVRWLFIRVKSIRTYGNIKLRKMVIFGPISNQEIKLFIYKNAAFDYVKEMKEAAKNSKKWSQSPIAFYMIYNRL